MDSPLSQICTRVLNYHCSSFSCPIESPLTPFCARSKPELPSFGERFLARPPRSHLVGPLVAATQLSPPRFYSLEGAPPPTATFTMARRSSSSAWRPPSPLPPATLYSPSLIDQEAKDLETTVALYLRRPPPGCDPPVRLRVYLFRNLLRRAGARLPLLRRLCRSVPYRIISLAQSRKYVPVEDVQEIEETKMEV